MPDTAMLLIAGAPSATYVKWSAELVELVPPGVVTVTSTVPAAPAGDTAVSDVLLATITPVAEVVPNMTEVAPVRAVPVTVTTVPPAVVPLVGETPETVGAGTATKVNWSAELVALVPLDERTVTSTVPVPAEVVAVIEVSLFMVKLAAGVAPKLTPVALGLVKPVPVMVTAVPPAAVPLVGAMSVTVGGGAIANASGARVAMPAALASSAIAVAVESTERPNCFIIRVYK